MLRVCILRMRWTIKAHDLLIFLRASQSRYEPVAHRLIVESTAAFVCVFFMHRSLPAGFLTWEATSLCDDASLIPKKTTAYSTYIFGRRLCLLCVPNSFTWGQVSCVFDRLNSCLDSCSARVLFLGKKFQSLTNLIQQTNLTFDGKKSKSSQKYVVLSSY